MNYKYDPTIIHETVIRDIIDIVSGVKDSEEIRGITGRQQSFKSLTDASSNLVIVFPNIVSTSVKIENASMVSKAIERKGITLLQMLFSALNVSDSKNAMDYISKFHTNLKFDGDLTVDEFIDTFDKYVVQKECHIPNIQLYEKVKKDLRNLGNYLPDNINETSLNQYRVLPRGYYGNYEETIIKEDHDTYIDTDTVKISQGSGNSGSRERDDDAKFKDKMTARKDKMEVIHKQLLDSDVKKANELIPTMMIVNFISSENDYEETQAVIGVKAKIYPVDSQDILSRLKLKHNDNNGLLKFIKATTREISFCRDFLFAIDKAKLDALSQSKRGSSSKLWKLLERRSLKSRVRRTLGQVNDASAITTLVISQEEVEYMKKTENIDLLNPRVIRPIMESYNFMGVCVVDEVLEVTNFIFDTGDDIYETLSFTHLERENTSNDYKKIINLMSKVSRG